MSLKINIDLLRFEGGVILCEICRSEEESSHKRAIVKVNAFVKGTTNFKLNAVKDKSHLGLTNLDSLKF